MRASTSIAVALSCLISSSLALPTPQSGVSSILGSITSPSAGDLNKLLNNGVGNGLNNGNSNTAGASNGDDNVAGSGNSINLKDRGLVDSILGSITNPSAGNGNVLEGNGASNGQNNGNGNTAGVDNGNGNTAGSGNSINVGDLPDITIDPDISILKP